MLTGPPSKFHGTRDILHWVADQVLRSGASVILDFGVLVR